jgi:hypothetical protein
MNEGVKILLARMETNPEEFNGEVNKWGNLLQYYKAYLDPEDANALNEGINKLLQQRFTEAVMKELLAPEEDDDMGKWFSAHKVGTPRGGATLSPSIPSITLDAQKYQTEIMKRHLDVHREHIKTVEVRKKAVLRKPHETLYGKLKNYLHSDT